MEREFVAGRCAADGPLQRVEVLPAAEGNDQGGFAARSRGSSPKLQVPGTALMTVTAGISPQEARSDGQFRGRLIESAVGAHRANAAAMGECELCYWRERGRKVDFVVKGQSRLTAIEVKSGRAPQAHCGTAAFAAAIKVRRTLLVGGGIGVEDFLSRPIAERLALTSEDRDGTRTGGGLETSATAQRCGLHRDAA
ncbi:MAG: DUF4143 domain-containing protein [Steroidobacteraceae bacterium]